MTPEAIPEIPDEPLISFAIDKAPPTRNEAPRTERELPIVVAPTVEMVETLSRPEALKEFPSLTVDRTDRLLDMWTAPVELIIPADEHTLHPLVDKIPEKTAFPRTDTAKLPPVVPDLKSPAIESPDPRRAARHSERLLPSDKESMTETLPSNPADSPATERAPPREQSPIALSVSPNEAPDKSERASPPTKLQATERALPKQPSVDTERSLPPNKDPYKETALPNRLNERSDRAEPSDEAPETENPPAIPPFNARDP